MKRLFVLMCLPCLFAMADLGRFDGETKHWLVDTGVLKCTFFQGCMYPVWFKGASDEEFPFFVLGDRIVHNKRAAYLREERWATFRVVENNSLRFIIECVGNFCYGQSPTNLPDTNVEATYRYEFARGSGEVGMRVTLRKRIEEVFEVELCVLRWRYLPFERFGELELKEGMPFGENRPHGAGRLRHAGMELWLGDHKVVLRREPDENTFFYLKDAEGVQSWPANSNELVFETRLCFGKNTQEGGK